MELVVKEQTNWIRRFESQPRGKSNDRILEF